MDYAEAWALMVACNDEPTTSTWIIEAQKYGITDTGLRKRVKAILGPAYRNKLGKGTELFFKCSYCGKPFSKMDYQLNGLGHYENRYCSRDCHNQYERENNTANSISEEELFYMYSMARSLYALSNELGISEIVLYKRLHNAGIQEATESVIRKYYLKPFVRRF